MRLGKICLCRSSRRQWRGLVLGLCLAGVLFGASKILAAPAPGPAPGPVLGREQIRAFRAWIVTIVEDQVSRGPNPRWHHRDCAGLVRFAIRESLARHDGRWRKANGFLGRPLPPEVELAPIERERLKRWKINSDDGSGAKTDSDFVRALPLIQNNAEFIGKTIERIEPGDLLFYDQGDEQHVMVWTGRRIVYHNGHRPRRGEVLKDNGLRAVSLRELMEFKDSRWQPKSENPNFIGFFRLAFLTGAAPSERGTP